MFLSWVVIHSLILKPIHIQKIEKTAFNVLGKLFMSLLVNDCLFGEIDLFLDLIDDIVFHSFAFVSILLKCSFFAFLPISNFSKILGFLNVINIHISLILLQRNASIFDRLLKIVGDLRMVDPFINQIRSASSCC